MSKQHVLIVEDERDIANLIKHAVERATRFTGKLPAVLDRIDHRRSPSARNPPSAQVAILKKGGS